MPESPAAQGRANSSFEPETGIAADAVQADANTAAQRYEFKLNGTVCGSVEAESPREAMEIWAADGVFGLRNIEYGEDTVTVNGVTYEVVT